MAQAATKSNLLVWFPLLTALMVAVSSSQLIDFSLIPRWMYLAVMNLVLLILARKSSPQTTLPFFLLLALGLWSLISSSWALNPVESYNTATHWFLAAAWYLALKNALSAQMLSSQLLARGWTLFGTLAALWALAEVSKLGGERDFWAAVYEVKANFGHKNLLSGALFLSLPFALLTSKESSAWRWLGLTGLVLLILAILLLRTRAVWLGLGISTLLYFAWPLVTNKLSKLKSALAVALPALLVAGAALLVYLGVAGNLTDATNLDRRVSFWNNSLEMIQEHPTTGVGAGNWRINFPKYGLGNVDKSLNNGITNIQRPHNDLLWVWAELGPIGIALFLFLFGWAFYTATNSLKQEEKHLQLPNLVVAALGGYFVYQLFDFPLERAEHQAMLISLIALLPAGKPKLEKLPWTWIAVTLAVFSLYVQYQRFTGEKAAVAVLEANSKQNAQLIIPAVEKAINPWYNQDNYGNPLMYYKGMGHFALRQLPQAKAAFDEAESLHPYNIVLLNQLGSWHKSQGQYKEALALYQRVLDISPFMEAANLNAAETCLLMKDYETGFRYLSMVYLDSENPKYYGLARDLIPPYAEQLVNQGKKAHLLQVIAGATSPEAKAEKWIMARRQLR